MRKTLVGSALVGLVCWSAPLVRAQPEALAIIDKAIKAHGGADKLAKMNSMKLSSKGTLEILGGSIPFTQEAMIQAPNKIKDQMQMDFMGQKIGVITVYNGEKGWINTNGQTMDMNDELLEHMKEAVYLFSIMGFSALKEKPFELSLLGEIKVNEKPAVGVKVSNKGHKDFSIYFDKESGLMVKFEYRTRDFMAGQDVNEERFFTDYREVDGVMTAKKILIHRDGKKFLDADVLETKFVEKFDDSEFVKP